MPITLREDKLLIANQMVTEHQIADLVAKHLNVVGRTRTLEATAQQLVEADFPGDALVSFVMEVCAWGGYKGIAGRVLRRNSGRYPRPVSECHKRVGCKCTGCRSRPCRC